MVFSGLKQFKAVSSFFNVAGNHCHSGLFLNFGLCCQLLPASSETEVSHLTHDQLPHLSTLAIHKDTAFPQCSKDTNKNLKIEKETLTSSLFLSPACWVIADSKISPLATQGNRSSVRSY